MKNEKGEMKNWLTRMSRALFFIFHFSFFTFGLGQEDSYAYPVDFSFCPPESDTVYIYDTICQWERYDTLGLVIQLRHTQHVSPLLFEHDHEGVHYIFQITVLPASEVHEYDSIAVGDTLVWNGIEVTTAGEYTVTFTAANGCDSLVTLHIVYQGDTIELFDTVCAGMEYSGYGFELATGDGGDTVLVRDTVEGGAPKHYVLHLAVLPIQHTVLHLSIIMGDTVAVCDTLLSTSGEYQFRYTSAGGCDSMVTVCLVYEQIGIEASATGVCPGTAVTIAATGTHTCIWTANPPDAEVEAQQGMNTITVHPMQTTVYSLLDGEGNVVATVMVGTGVAPTICVEVSRDVLDFDNPVLLFIDCSEGRHSTRWEFGDDRVLTGEKVRRRYSYPLPDSAVVTMTSCNRWGCCADTTLAIPMKINSVWFPNVFTPGRDNNNLFRCITSVDVEVFEITMFNRWGMVVWSSKDVGQGWDGRSNDGVACPQGAYAYRYYLKATDGAVHTGAGTVTLLR